MGAQQTAPVRDDPVARLRTLPRLNSAGVRVLGAGLLTVRVDLAE